MTPPNCPVFTSFFHVMRYRLRGFTSHMPTLESCFWIAFGTRLGFRICAKVGMVILSFLQRAAVFLITDWFSLRIILDMSNLFKMIKNTLFLTDSGHFPPYIKKKKDINVRIILIKFNKMGDFFVSVWFVSEKLSEPLIRLMK